MVVIATHLRVRTIILFPYLDDWLVRNQCHFQFIKDREFTLSLITSLGLIINREKSELMLSQNFTFIGMEFITQNNTVRVPQDRVLDVLDLNSWVRKQVAVTARMFLFFLRKLSTSAQFFVLGRLHLRPLQMALFAQWKPHVLPLEHKILLTQQIKRHLGWWLTGTDLHRELCSNNLPQYTQSFRMRVVWTGLLIWNRRDSCVMEIGIKTNLICTLTFWK